ncbi:MAG: adenylate/guanylate cyclase domain-containing protein [Candidatus Uhrbacteria bacterium]|nr:adenylate/guanylate cyclase domain-containing protein [Candidatus Uhrbacteria bacterium]
MKKSSSLPSCHDFHKVLAERIEHPERSVQIDRRIKKEFEKTRTIFVLDMSGFSRTVQRYGLIHYLAMIHKMQRITRPIVERHKGLVVKYEADNCFAVFPNPDLAVAAALDIQHDLEVANLMTDDESDVHVAIGIGHGPILLFCDDLFGNEMNLASKLGEDTADKGEVLLTAAAKKAIKSKSFSFHTFPLTVSGLNMRAFKLKNK